MELPVRKPKVNEKELAKAKEYAMRSLTCLDQTESQIRRKLKQRDYCPEIIDRVLEFLKSYNYINDQRFLEQYVACHCKRMNRRQLLDRLSNKGLRVVNIDEYLELYEYDEEELLENALRKYVNGKDLKDLKVRQKVTAHFLQKGYSCSAVRNVVHFDAEDCIS